MQKGAAKDLGGHPGSPSCYQAVAESQLQIGNLILRLAAGVTVPACSRDSGLPPRRRQQPHDHGCEQHIPGTMAAPLPGHSAVVLELVPKVSLQPAPVAFGDVP
jgi:hypothetical protein